MTDDNTDSPLFTLGIFAFVACGFVALEMSGFGFGFQMTLQKALIISTILGGIGGALISEKRIPGFIAGLVAGPLGMFAVYYYTQNRQNVFHLELVVVQGIASLPALGLYHLLCKVLPEEDEFEAN